MTEEQISVMREGMVLLYDAVSRSLDAMGEANRPTRTQIMALDRIVYHPGMSQKELSVMLSTTKQYTSQVVKRLEALGLVEGKTPFSDGRKQQLYATELGLERKRGAEAENSRQLTRAMAALSREEAREFYRAFETLREMVPRVTQEGKTRLF